MSDLSLWKVGFKGGLGGQFFLCKVGARERPSQGDEALKTLHELFAGHDLSPS